MYLMHYSLICYTPSFLGKGLNKIWHSAFPHHHT